MRVTRETFVFLQFFRRVFHSTLKLELCRHACRRRCRRRDAIISTCRYGKNMPTTALVAIGHFQAIWPCVDSGWPLHDLWPQQCIILWSGVPLTKFGSHRAFLKQLDLWMTFNLWWGHFKNTFLSLKGLSPIPLPIFSPISRSMTKCIARHTHTPTHPHPHTHLSVFVSPELSSVRDHRKFLSNRTGAFKRDIWTRAGNVIAPSLKY